jgi:hypothetical protein
MVKPVDEQVAAYADRAPVEGRQEARPEERLEMVGLPDWKIPA